jgi:hypothetical protein
MEQPVAEEALLALEPLVGEWTVEANGPDGQAWPGEGRATFEWHSSKAHLVQRMMIDVPGAPGQHFDYRMRRGEWHLSPAVQRRARCVSDL